MSVDRVIVSYSGGLTSFEAGRRAMERYGPDRVKWWFCDTRIEDADLYRFNRDVEQLLGIDIRVLADGRTPWELFADEGMMGNTRADLCSRVLKRDLFHDTLAAECDPVSTLVVLGMDDIDDCARIKRTRALFLRGGWETWFPLTEHPIVFKRDIIAWLEAEGVKAPALYYEGAPHNNCGGFCVKAGLGHFEWLLRARPAVYAAHEEQERRFRAATGKHVAILRDRRGGQATPLTLEALRERIESGQTFDRGGGFACSCFSPVQGRLDLGVTR